MHILNGVGSVGKIEEYLVAVKNARRVVSSDEFDLKHKRKEVERLISRTVEPLIDAMLLNELSFELSDEELAKGAALPQELKGHLLELRFFLNDPKGFDLYKGTYKGGHVERELEEVIETTTDYIALATGVSP